MSIFLLENGEMMNDVNEIINYDGDYKMLVGGELDDIDSMWEMYESNGRKLIDKQIKIQDKALVKFKLQSGQLLDESRGSDSVNFHDLLESLIKLFCKKNKKVIPSLLYIDYCYR